MKERHLSIPVERAYRLLNDDFPDRTAYEGWPDSLALAHHYWRTSHWPPMMIQDKMLIVGVAGWLDRAFSRQALRASVKRLDLRMDQDIPF